MALCKKHIHLRKKLDVCVGTETESAVAAVKKRKLLHRSSVSVSVRNEIPEPVVYNPLTPTNINSQRIRGLRPSEDYIVEVNGTADGVTYSGREFSKTVSLTEGQNIFTVRLSLNGDKSKQIPVFIELDTIAPVTQILANGSPVLDRAITNHSFILDFAVTELHPPVTTFFKINNGVTQVFSGNYIISEENVYEISYWSHDSLGNTESLKSVKFVIDRTPPSRPIIDIDNLPTITNVSEILVTGASSDDTIRISVNGFDAVLHNDHSWQIVTTLTEGPNLITAYAYDEAGNESGPASVSIFLDQTPPPIPTLIAPENHRTRRTAIRLIGSQSSDTAKVLVNGIEARLTSPVRWAFDVELEEGNNSFSIVAIDEVGNISYPLNVVLTKDTTGPAAITIDPYLSPRNQSVILLTGRCSADTVRIAMNNNVNIVIVNPDRTWRALFDLTQENLNVLKFEAEDDLENRSLPVFANIVLDRVPPQMPSIDSIPLFSNVEVRLVEGNKPADATEVLINGSSVGVTYPTATRWQLSMTMAVGFNTIEARAKDYVGNISEPVMAFTTYKPAPPAVSLDSIPANTIAQNIKLTGTHEQYSAVQINSQNAVYPDGVGGRLWEYEAPLRVGQNDFIIKAFDQAGNVSNPISATTNRLLPITYKNFFINSVYAFGSDNRNHVRINSEQAPVLTSRLIKSILLIGKKPAGAKITSNFEKIELPDGVNGTVWRALVPMDFIRTEPLQLTLAGDRVVSPPVIVVSKLVIVQNIVVGTLTFMVGPDLTVELDQNAACLMTDHQLNTISSTLTNTLSNQISITNVL